MLKKIPLDFAKSVNDMPVAYCGPRNSLERYLTTTLVRFFLKRNKSIHIVGCGSGDGKNAEFIIEPPRFLASLKILVDPEFQVGETFIRGEWYLSKGDMTDFLNEIFRSQEGAYLKYFRKMKKLTSVPFFFRQYFFPRKATRKSADHYNVESKIYELILDREFFYTCAFFENETMSLDDAQFNKVDTIVSRMQLPQENASLLDIGCGWGSMMRRTVKTLNKVDVTGISYAENQVLRARSLDVERMTAAERKQMKYVVTDYLDFEPQNGGYDGISVVGMMEHVGLKHHNKFVKKIGTLLKPNGRAVIHTILSPVSRKPNNRWIDKYIFPGGYTPSLEELSKSTRGSSVEIESFHSHDGSNYQRTMELWKKNFLKNYQEICELFSVSSFSAYEVDRNVRIWYFYLSSLQNMFDRDLLDYKIGHVVLRRKSD
jgi:cyclopropane-fatty-acyl-phospholipid synthase